MGSSDVAEIYLGNYNWQAFGNELVMAVEREGGSQFASLSYWMNHEATNGMGFNKREPQNRPSVSEKFLVSRNGFQQRAYANVSFISKKKFNLSEKAGIF